MWLELNPHLQKHLPTQGVFDHILNLPGQVHREVKHRRTFEVELGGRPYFIKTHRGCGWSEIFKDLLQGRAPVLGARTEWEAIESLTSLGVATMTIAGRGERGVNPARQESFLITEALENCISLEEMGKDWKGVRGPQREQLRRAAAREVAAIAARLHSAGINHRDFYLCHFLTRERNWTKRPFGESLDLHLIDLHRTQRRAKVPTRWLVKDLGGLLFSALDAEVTRRDLLRFYLTYIQSMPHLGKDPKFWMRVRSNAARMYRSFHGKESVTLARIW